MKIEYRAADPDTIELSMTITMSLADWSRLKEQLMQGYPLFRLSDPIRNMMIEAHEHFILKSESDGK